MQNDGQSRAASPARVQNAPGCRREAPPVLVAELDDALDEAVPLLADDPAAVDEEALGAAVEVAPTGALAAAEA